MKNLKKLLSLLLALLLGVLPCFAAGIAAPAASADAAFADGLLPDSELSQTAAQNAVSKPEPDPLVPEPDFDALVAASADRCAGVFLRSAPIYYAANIQFFQGNYAAYQDAATGNWGVVDCSGRVLWQPNDPGIQWLEVFSCGLVLTHKSDYVVEGDLRVYTVNGERLDPDDLPGVDWYREEADYATGTLQFLTGSKWGDPGTSWLFDAAGHCIIAEGIGPVYGGTLPCKRGGKWGLCDLDNRTLLPYTYDSLQFISADTLLARIDNVWRLIDRSGATVAILSGCEEASPLAPDSDSILVRENGLWGLRDASGGLTLECRYTALNPALYDGVPYFNGLENGKWHFLSADGAIDVCYADEDDQSKSVILVADNLLCLRDEERFFVIDAKGNERIPGVYAYYPSYQNGYLLLKKYEEDKGTDGNYVVYDPELKPVAELNGVKRALLTTQAYCWLESTTLHCTSFRDGTDRQIENVSNVYEGNPLLVWRDQACAVADAYGNLRTEFRYTDTALAPDGLALLWRDDAWYLLDSRGSELTPPLDDLIVFAVDSSPYAAYRSDNKYGILQFRSADDPMFTDTEAGKWYTAGTDFCALAGLMNGVGGGRFDPQGATTRAMLVRVLYNLSGSKCDSHGFVDVAEGRWYTDAINWAAACGIVNGVDPTHFDPDAPITREQMVTILYRYAAKFHDFEAADGATEAFADADQISRYALEAMQWAVTHGLINGKTPTTLDPKGHATRAEIATVLTRFVKFMADCGALPALP